MKKTIIIAEAGVNHNGDIGLAKQLIDVAAEAGADYVKFQTFKADKVVSKNAKQADYQMKNQSSQVDDTQYSMLKKLELSEDDHYVLQRYAEEKGIKFLSTGFDLGSIDFLDVLGMELYKIPSGEITNYPYLQHIAKKGKPIVISTGMATLGEVENALNVLQDGGAVLDDVTVLHCNTDYPTQFSDVNLSAMLTIQQAFKVKVGYSDHTLGLEVPIAAVALGAGVIEKHFTLSRDMEGPDHKASLEPGELSEMVKAIRNVEMAMSGSGHKVPSESERKNLLAGRKSIHLATEVKEGEIVQPEHLTVKRPGDGISPVEWQKITGKRYTQNLCEDHKLSWSDFK